MSDYPTGPADSADSAYHRGLPIGERVSADPLAGNARRVAEILARHGGEALV